LRGLFLDFDGTLADSLPAMRRAYGAFLEGFGAPATEAEFEALNGPPLAVIVRSLKAAHGLPPDEAALAQVYRARIAEAAAETRPAAGALDLLEAARARGWTVAVVSSASRPAIESFLARHRLDALVALVVGGEDVAAGKPDPEPYAQALRRTGCAAERSLAVEDSFSGAAAALAAGLPTWMVGEGKAPEGVRGRLPGLEAVVNLL
jgi:HAD superfamily hydrolase (TIGR01509 family)